MNYLFKLTIAAVTIAVSSLQMQAQTKVVKGSVKDSKTKENLPGVTIVVPKTTIGVASDENGNFSIFRKFQKIIFAIFGKNYL